jgi:acetylornithine/N-succinyldiaminopimelate aminotransferase
MTNAVSHGNIRHMIKSSHYPLSTPHGESSKHLIDTAKTCWSENYAPRSMIIDRGKGATVWDKDNNDYIDLGAGIAVCSLGHQDEDLLAALDAQSRKIWHTSNIFYTEPPIVLAELLVQSAPFAKRAYFCNSGAEAIEATIKIIRKWAANEGRAPDHREIITFKGSFHGRTLASVTATAQPKYHEGFEPLPAGFVYCDEFNDLGALEALITKKTAAIILEPVQGEGGIRPATIAFMQGVRALCDKHNILYVVDEIQCGVARTGVLYGHMYGCDAQPDIMTLAKALGCGVPIGATLLGAKVEHTLQVGTHGSTFGGNPLMCAVAIAAMKKLSTASMLQHVVERSQQAFTHLNTINDDLHIFSEIRGRGLMIGAELIPAHHGKASAISELSRQFGVLTLVAGPDVCRLLPPLNITSQELHEGLSRFHAACKHYLQQQH